jgi:hypothetical protein
MNYEKSGADEKVHLKKLVEERTRHLERELTELKQAQDALKTMSRGLRVLNETAIRLNAGKAGKELYVDITRKLKELTGGSSATLGLYDSTEKCVRVQHEEIDQGAVSDLIEALGGRRLTEVAFPVSAEFYGDLKKSPIGYVDSLSEATLGVVPKLVGGWSRRFRGLTVFWESPTSSRASFTALLWWRCVPLSPTRPRSSSIRSRRWWQ